MPAAVVENGIEHIAGVRGGLLSWMEEHDSEWVRQVQGSRAAGSVANPAAFGRGNYMNVLSSYVLRSNTR